MYIVLLLVVSQGCSPSNPTVTPTPGVILDHVESDYSYPPQTSLLDIRNITTELNGTDCPIIYDSDNCVRRIFVVPAPQNFTVKLICSRTDFPKSVANITHCLNTTSDAIEIASLFSLCPKESPSRKPTYSTWRTWTTTTTRSPWSMTPFRHRPYHRRFRNRWGFRKRFC